MAGKGDVDSREISSLQPSIGSEKILHLPAYGDSEPVPDLELGHTEESTRKDGTGSAHAI